MKLHRLCRADEIAESAGRGFRLGSGATELAVFVVRRDGTLHAYRNACPHRGVPLDWQPDVFFDSTGRYLQCSTHGALFRPEDGFCLAGPCIGDALDPLPLVQDGDDVFVDLDS